LSHYLQKRQCTFRELLLERWLKHVEDGLKGGSTKSVKELAIEAGFNDLLFLQSIPPPPP